MTDPITMSLLVLSGLLAAGAVGFLSMGVYENVFVKFVRDFHYDSGGGARGASSIVVRRLGTLNQHFIWPSYESRVRRNLVRAGEPGAYRPEDVMALQELAFVGGLIFGVIVLQGLNQSLGWCLAFAAFGAYYPLLWVRDQVKRRHLMISRALPNSLDLLTLAVEAGLDFTAALAKVVEKGKPGPLREELQLVLKQLKMGKTREEALKSLIARVDLPALNTFVTALIQADRMGTSLGKILRIQSTQMRIERTQRAEKLANEAPVKMLFPLIACIFPTVFFILFGPIVFAMIFGNVAGG